MHQLPDPTRLQSKDSGFSGSSYNTIPSDYSSFGRPPLVHHQTTEGRLEYQRYTHTIEHDYPCHTIGSPRSSTETYASTLDFEDHGVEDKGPKGQHPPSTSLQYYASDTVPATPSDFAELFPSSRSLSIKHDDSTNDGNMNLRIDTTAYLPNGRDQEVTLFYLRMHDLKRREFSLRRYCRDSGREVCHSVRKYQKSTAERRPSLGRSFSHAFAALRSKSDNKTFTASTLKRSDSGYASVISGRSMDDRSQSIPEVPSISKRPPIPTNTTKLEFSNYSQLEIKRRGSKNSKRYEFEYWGTVYTWRRVVETAGLSTRTRYCLFRSNDTQVLARIEPHALTREQAHDEWSKGGWIPPCIMRIDDKQILQAQNETSDVVVASGLIMLVDDCIKQQFYPQSRRQLIIPVPRLRLDMDYAGTKALLKEMLYRSKKPGDH